MESDFIFIGCGLQDVYGWCDLGSGQRRHFDFGLSCLSRCQVVRRQETDAEAGGRG